MLFDTWNGGRHHISKREYARVGAAQGDTLCCYCGKDDEDFQIEHFRPVSLDGTNEIWNLAIACQACNTRKAATPLDRWLAANPAIPEKTKARIHIALAGGPTAPPPPPERQPEPTGPTPSGLPAPRKIAFASPFHLYG